MRPGLKKTQHIHTRKGPHGPHPRLSSSPARRRWRGDAVRPPVGPRSRIPASAVQSVGNTGLPPPPPPPRMGRRGALGRCAGCVARPERCVALDLLISEFEVQWFVSESWDAPMPIAQSYYVSKRMPNWIFPYHGSYMHSSVVEFHKSLVKLCKEFFRTVVLDWIR